MLISLAQYAAQHGKSDSTARQMALRGHFATAQKVGRNWMIDSSEPWPDYRTQEYKEAGKMEGMEYNSQGDLIVDGIYVDARYQTGRIVKIGESYYMFCGTMMYESGQAFAKALRPLPNYKAPECLEMVSSRLAMMCNHCVYRSTPEDFPSLGRAITSGELSQLIDAGTIVPAGEEFEAYVFGIENGEETRSPYTAQSFTAETLDVLSIETDLKKEGIQAYNGAPGMITIRIR